MKKLLWVACASGIGWLAGSLGNVEGQTLVDPGTQGTPSVEAKPVRPRSALQAGIDLFKKAEYEQADMQLRQAEMGQQQLSEEDKTQLDKYLKQNTEALRGRRTGQTQIQQAEQAIHIGQWQNADMLIKTLKTNPYLSAKDQKQVASLSDQLKKKSGKSGGSDTVKKDPDVLLAEARKALENKDYDSAVMLARESERAGYRSVFPWSDNPGKVISAAETAKAKHGTAPAGDKTAQARGLLQQAHMAVQAGDTVKARRLLQQADDLKVSLAFYEEYTPEKVRNEIVRAEAASVKGPAPAKADVPAKSETSSAASTDAKAMVKEAKLCLNKGELDRAEDLAKRARLVPGTKWGLFEETPDKVLEEVVKHREAQNATKASDLLVEARKKLEANQLDDAERLCHQAQALKSEYPVWHRGERPDRILKDIAAKRRLTQKSVLPPLPEGITQKAATPAPSTPASPAMPANPVMPAAASMTPPPAPVVTAAAPVMAAATPAMTTPPMTAPPLTAPPVMETPSQYAPSAPDMNQQQVEMAMARKQQQAQELCIQARLCLNRGDHGQAMQLAAQAKGLNVQLRVGDDNPEDILRAVQAVQNNSFAKEQQSAVAADASRQQALRYCAEARMFQKEGRLIEALQAAQTAVKLNATFGPNDETPDRVVAELQVGAKGQYDQFYGAAQQLINAGKYAEAEEYLRYVEKLSVCYLMDTQAVLQQMAQVKRLASSGGPDNAVQLTGEGQQYLAQARREMQRGDLAQARKLAEAVYTGPYGMKQEANKLLGELDDAQYKADVKRAQLAFEMGQRAFIRKEYDVAASYLVNVDLKLLDEHNRSRCQEMLASRFMNPNQIEMVRPVASAAGNDRAPAAQAPVQASIQGAPREVAQPVLSANSQAQGTDQRKPGSSMVDEVRSRQLIELQRLREMKINAEKQANQLAGMNKISEAIATLETGVKTLKSSGLDADQIRPMQLQLESRIKQLTTMRDQQEVSKLAEKERTAKTEVAKRLAMADATKKEKVADLMKQYKTLMDEGKYTEACAVAMRAHEVNPDDPAVDAAYDIAKTKRALTRESDALKAKEMGNSDSSIALVESATAPTTEHMNHPEYPKDWAQKTENRRGKTWLPARPPTKEDKEVTSKLDMTVSVDFKNKPLGDVLNELRAMTSVNIVPDMVNLQTDNVSLDQPVTISLDKVRLKTALDLLLKNARLTYVVHDGVLLVTTPAGQKGRNERRIFPVADLIVPVDNMTNVADGRIKGNDTNKAVTELLAGLGNSNLQVNVANPPGTTGYIPGGGQQTGSAKNQRQAGQTMEEQLIKLICDTIEPQSWDVMGGSGHIEFYPLNMTMVVSQTPDIQEQVQLLLERLRDLQNLQVTVEVRFLTLSEDFYERIGVDFDINILSKQRKFEREVVAGAFAPAGQVNAPNEHNVVVGLTPQGTVTQDLNIPVNSSSFSLGIPPFGGFPNQAGANGGLDMGVAFLSDIEVFLFMEAAQGDKRTSILTAPKITLFNGQQAAITVNRVQPYVATIITIPGNFGGAPGQFPIIQNAISQTSLAVQAVVSADRRYVQLTLNPIIQRTTLDASTQFTFNSGGPFGTQTIQQPITDTLALGTTVSVPDGGTILLGGFKNLNEGRNEFGPPVLSKIPYINRLFTNTGYGREEQSLLFMVTPHIIIPEEEEERLGQTFAF